MYIKHTTCTAHIHHAYATNISTTDHTCLTLPQLYPIQQYYLTQLKYSNYQTNHHSTYTTQTPNLHHIYRRQMPPPLHINYTDIAHNVHIDTNVTCIPHSYTTPTPNTQQQIVQTHTSHDTRIPHKHFTHSPHTHHIHITQISSTHYFLRIIHIPHTHTYTPYTHIPHKHTPYIHHIHAKHVPHKTH